MGILMACMYHISENSNNIDKEQINAIPMKSYPTRVDEGKKGLPSSHDKNDGTHRSGGGRGGDEEPAS